MPGKLTADELLPETKKKLGINHKIVDPKVVALGRVLQDLQGLTKRDALWACRTAIVHIRGYRKKSERA